MILTKAVQTEARLVGLPILELVIGYPRSDPPAMPALR